MKPEEYTIIDNPPQDWIDRQSWRRIVLFRQMLESLGANIWDRRDQIFSILGRIYAIDDGFGRAAIWDAAMATPFVQIECERTDLLHQFSWFTTDDLNKIFGQTPREYLDRIDRTTLTPPNGMSSTTWAAVLLLHQMTRSLFGKLSVEDFEDVVECAFPGGRLAKHARRAFGYGEVLIACDVLDLAARYPGIIHSRIWRQHTAEKIKQPAAISIVAIIYDTELGTVNEVRLFNIAASKEDALRWASIYMTVTYPNKRWTIHEADPARIEKDEMLPALLAARPI